MRTDLLKVDFSNYESPIKKLVMEVEKKMMQEEENQLFMSVKQAVGFSVDKEELLKALKYDRDQYEKGYIDGLKANDWIPTKERVPTTSEDVLITHSNGVSVGYWNGAYWTSGRRAGKMLKTVTAWMPLPEGYKGD